MNTLKILTLWVHQKNDLLLNYMKGVVYKSTGSWYNVKADNGKMYSCRVKGRFRIQGIKSTNPVSVGDKVFFEEDLSSKDKQTGVIKKIEDRKNYIIRKSVNLSKQTHIIAANIDRVFLMVTLKDPETSTVFIDRFLATAEAYHIDPILLLHKFDIYSEEELNDVRYLASIYQNIGYTCIGTSINPKRNIDKVQDLMQGKTCLFSGHSGVGKSTLINALAPHLDLKTAKISSQHASGRHTTTFAEMFDVNEETQLIDTPGIKGFGLVEMEKEEVGNYFPEFLALKEHCKFNNCIHLKEPGCAVKEALENNELSWSRYDSYLQIIASEDDDYRPDIYHQKQ